MYMNTNQNENNSLRCQYDVHLYLQIYLGGAKGNPTTEKPNHATENEPETGLYLY